MKIVRKYSSVILIIIILFLIVTLLVKNKSIAESTEKISGLQTKIENVKEDKEKEDKGQEDTGKKDTNSSDTFDEDLKWFVTKTYETSNRLQLYEDIKDSVSQGVLEALLGDELPPEENENDEESALREVTNLDVYGKYGSDGKFKAVVLFDVTYKFKDNSDSKKVLASIEITNQKGSWIITKFEELN